MRAATRVALCSASLWSLSSVGSRPWRLRLSVLEGAKKEKLPPTLTEVR
jgi:hypothetical protein